LSARIPNKAELRSLWLKVHKWLGLTLAVPVILIFLSGSALVWKDSVDQLLHAGSHSQAAPAQTAEFYASAIARSVPASEHPLTLSFPRSRGPVTIVTAVLDEQGIKVSQARYYLDPVTGSVTGQSPRMGGVFGKLHVLHGSLLLGRPGGRLVGLTALALILSAFSGLWLWWPTKGPLIGGLRWARTQSTNTNLHHQAGFWVAVPLVVLCITGASITFQNYFNRILGETAAVQQENVRASAAPLPGPRLTLDRVLREVNPSDRRAIDSISWPTKVDDRWRIVLKGGREREFSVDDSTGTINSAETSQTESTARLFRRIHDGTGFPFIWQVIIFLCGLIGPLLGVTGVIIWLRGRTREKEMRARRAQRSLKS